MESQTQSFHEASEAMDERYEEKEERQAEKGRRMTNMESMLRRVVEDQQEIRHNMQTSERMCKDKRGEFLTEVQKLGQEKQKQMHRMYNTWQRESRRQHQALMETIHTTAGGGPPVDVKHHLDEFSRSLAQDVRGLLSQVGHMREERRGLQYDVGTMLIEKSKYGPDDEYHPDWRPPTLSSNLMVTTPQPIYAPGPSEPIPGSVSSGWRARKSRPRHGADKQAIHSQPPRLQPNSRTPVPSWQTWKPDPINAPSEDSSIIESKYVVPRKEPPELFGPRGLDGW